MAALPKTRGVTVDCPVPGCRPTLDIEIVAGEPVRGPGQSVTVELKPAPGALKKAVREHFAEAHPDVEIEESAQEYLDGDDDE